MTQAPCLCVLFSVPSYIQRRDKHVLVVGTRCMTISLSRDLFWQGRVQRGCKRVNPSLVLFFSLSFCPSLPLCLFSQGAQPLSDVRSHAGMFRIIRNHALVLPGIYFSAPCQCKASGLSRYPDSWMNVATESKSAGDFPMRAWAHCIMLNPCFYQIEKKESISANTAADFLPGSFVEISKLT